MYFRCDFHMSSVLGFGYCKITYGGLERSTRNCSILPLNRVSIRCVIQRRRDRDKHSGVHQTSRVNGTVPLDSVFFQELYNLVGSGVVGTISLLSTFTFCCCPLHHATTRIETIQPWPLPKTRKCWRRLIRLWVYVFMMQHANQEFSSMKVNYILFPVTGG